MTSHFGHLSEYQLDRCLDDVDDEVRDRATLYLKVFTEKPLADAYVREGLSFMLTFMSSFLIHSWTLYLIQSPSSLLRRWSPNWWHMLKIRRRLNNLLISLQFRRLVVLRLPKKLLVSS